MLERHTYSEDQLETNTLKSLLGFTSTCSTPCSSVQTLFGMRWRAARFLLSDPYPVTGEPILTVT